MNKPQKETIRSRLHISDLIPRIVCVAIALTLWLYVMSNESPDYERTFSGATVEPKNTAVLKENHGLSVVQFYNGTLDITVTGKKGEIVTYSLEDIQAEVDVQYLDAPGRHSLPVSVSVPNGCVLKSVSPANVEVYVEEIKEKTLTIDVQLNSAQYDQSLSLGILTPKQTEVKVSGPASVIDTAAKAVVALDLGTVTTGLTATGPLQIVTADGTVIDNPYLKLSPTSVDVTVPVYQTRVLPVRVTMMRGYLNESNATVQVTPDTITVRADPKLLEGMTEIAVATLDETKLTGDSTQIAKIQLPEGFENVSDADTVLVSVRHKGTVIKSLALTDIRLANPNKLKYTAVGDSVNVALRVPADLADSLLAEDFSVAGELNYSHTQGVVQVPLTVQVPAQYKDRVYAIGEYTLTVNLGQ